jgi:hypothetical protein
VKVPVTIEIDLNELPRYTDEHIATLWHVAQANPAPFGDGLAGEIVSKLMFEIVRRWLTGVSPELYHHQPHHHYWEALSQFAKYEGGEHGTPDWYRGKWVAKTDDGEAK